MNITGAMLCKELPGNVIAIMREHKTECRTAGYTSKNFSSEEDTSLDKYFNYEVKIDNTRKDFPIKIRFIGFLINILLKYRRKDINILKEYLTYL